MIKNKLTEEYLEYWMGKLTYCKDIERPSHCGPMLRNKVLRWKFRPWLMQTKHDKFSLSSRSAEDWKQPSFESGVLVQWNI